MFLEMVQLVWRGRETSQALNPVDILLFEQMLKIKLDDALKPVKGLIRDSISFIQLVLSYVDHISGMKLMKCPTHTWSLKNILTVQKGSVLMIFDSVELLYNKYVQLCQGVCLLKTFFNQSPVLNCENHRLQNITFLEVLH